MSEIPFDEETLRGIVSKTIEKDEALGEGVGGSGHRGYVSYGLDEVGAPWRSIEEGVVRWEVTYRYTVFIETEFTYYPDNPPYETHYRKTIVLDVAGVIVRGSDREYDERSTTDAGSQIASDG